VLHVLYLIVNEGYAHSSGPNLQRSELSGEAIRLARAVHGLLRDDGEVAGLLALMLLTDARRAARTGPNGELIPLPEQTRPVDRNLISEGIALLNATLSKGSIGAYQLQAAIAAVHDEGHEPRTPTGRRSWPSTACSKHLRQSRGDAQSRHRRGHGARPDGRLRLLEALDAG
jgi:predicted RNA polymerase sigma factor